MLGRLTIDALPFYSLIAMGGAAVTVLGGLVVLAVILWLGVRYVRSEWITSVDHKRIGIMYIMFASVMLLRGFADAIMMRASRRSRSTPTAICRPAISIRSSARTARS